MSHESGLYQYIPGLGLWPGPRIFPYPFATLPCAERNGEFTVFPTGMPQNCGGFVHSKRTQGSSTGGGGGACAGTGRGGGACKTPVTAGIAILCDGAVGARGVGGAAGLFTSSGSPRCIPLLLIINASVPVLTMRVVATASRPFFMSRAGFPFNTPMFTGASPSACKRSSIPSSTDSP